MSKRAADSLSDGEIAEMVLNKENNEDSRDDDDDIVNSGEKIPIDDMVKMCDQLIGIMEQRALINEREIMTVYSIKERLLRQKPMLIRQMTLEEVFKEAVSHSAAELENPIPGPSSDVRLQHKYDGHHDNDDDTDVASSPGSSSKV
jgi:hypothetical protein